MSKPPTDPVYRALARATARITEELTSLGIHHPVILIDGRSGSLKSSLAQRLSESWPSEHSVTTVHLDDLYPGWDGLAEGSELLREQILDPFKRARPLSYRKWDWAASEWGEAVNLDVKGALIVEGCGAITPATKLMADLTLWLESPEESRKVRAVGRDGDETAANWDKWAEQEQALIAKNDPVALADIVVELP